MPLVMRGDAHFYHAYFSRIYLRSWSLGCKSYPTILVINVTGSLSGAYGHSSNPLIAFSRNMNIYEKDGTGLILMALEVWPFNYG